MPIKDKYGLSVDEAAEYFGIGRKKIRELSDREDCPFVLWVGGKRLIKRNAFEKYCEERFSI